MQTRRHAHRPLWCRPRWGLELGESTWRQCKQYLSDQRLWPAIDFGPTSNPIWCASVQSTIAAAVSVWTAFSISTRLWTAVTTTACVWTAIAASLCFWITATARVWPSIAAPVIGIRPAVTTTVDLWPIIRTRCATKPLWPAGIRAISTTAIGRQRIRPTKRTGCEAEPLWQLCDLKFWYKPI
jgi:hypothetical protein